MNYKDKFIKTALRQKWLDSNGIVCAVSGGGDSVAMLWLMKSVFKGKIVVAHIDHCTRNGESHKDAEFVKKLSEKWQIDCCVKTVDVHNLKLTGESFEMAGRRIRYEYFDQIAQQYNIPFIAVAHNSNDVVETQLLNLARGSGITGLRGIPEVNGNIIRPVIDFSREELRNILSENHISWCEDYTNAKSDYTRNKVRNILIPWIKTNLNPSFENVMLGLSRQAYAETKEMRAIAYAEMNKIYFNQPPALAAWKNETINNLSDLILSEMLRLQADKLNLPVLSRKRTEELIELIRRGGFWRFQWALDIEVCYSNRGIGWLKRSDIEKSRKNTADSKKNNLPWWAR